MPLNDMTAFDSHGVADIDVTLVEVHDQVMLPGTGHWSPVRQTLGHAVVVAEWDKASGESLVTYTPARGELLHTRRDQVFGLDEILTISDGITTATTTTRGLLS